MNERPLSRNRPVPQKGLPRLASDQFFKELGGGPAAALLCGIFPGIAVMADDFPVE
jgi:hypothetical protein